MPVIEGADLTKVSTTYEPLPEGEYLLNVKEVIWADENKKAQVIINEVLEPVELKGRTHRDYVNLFTKEGKLNEISLSHIKRYLEAVFGKGSPEAEATPPDTDLLVGHQTRQYLIVDSYEDRTTKEEKKNNKAKKIMKA